MEKKTDKCENRQRNHRKNQNSAENALPAHFSVCSENTKNALKHDRPTLPRPSRDPPATLPKPSRDPPQTVKRSSWIPRDSSGKSGARIHLSRRSCAVMGFAPSTPISEVALMSQLWLGLPPAPQHTNDSSIERPCFKSICVCVKRCTKLFTLSGSTADSLAKFLLLWLRLADLQAECQTQWRSCADLHAYIHQSVSLRKRADLLDSKQQPRRLRGANAGAMDLRMLLLRQLPMCLMNHLCVDVLLVLGGAP